MIKPVPSWDTERVLSTESDTSRVQSSRAAGHCSCGFPSGPSALLLLHSGARAAPSDPGVQPVVTCVRAFSAGLPWGSTAVPGRGPGGGDALPPLDRHTEPLVSALNALPWDGDAPSGPACFVAESARLPPQALPQRVPGTSGNYANVC